jgi:hypothetical protein
MKPSKDELKRVKNLNAILSPLLYQHQATSHSLSVRTYKFSAAGRKKQQEIMKFQLWRAFLRAMHVAGCQS